jgi:hypothetical protein
MEPDVNKKPDNDKLCVCCRKRPYEDELVMLCSYCLEDLYYTPEEREHIEFY